MSCKGKCNFGGVPIGASTRLIYDKCAYDDRLEESVSPLLHQINPTQLGNCDGCLSVFGPRASGNAGYGISTTSGSFAATAQDNIEIESILSNRNVPTSKCKDGKVNKVDLSKFTLQHARICNDFLDPICTSHTNPAANYRGLAINRFHDLPKNPQRNIFYDFAVNTKLEAKDNYVERIPMMVRHSSVLPKENRGTVPQCRFGCKFNCPHE